jgi:hypothetical protein
MKLTQSGNMQKETESTPRILRMQKYEYLGEFETKFKNILVCQNPRRVSLAKPV